ncbi:MAG: Hpt domain-containing protein [Lachnospiraceae bacterium]
MSQLIDSFASYGADIKGIMERLMGDEELLEKCLEQFTKDEGFEKLEQALEEQDYTQAFEHAHALKGVSGNLGLTPLYGAICRLVEALRSKTYDNISVLKQEVFHEKEVFIAVFRQGTGGKNE